MTKEQIIKENWEEKFDKKFKVFKTRFKLSGKSTFALGFVRATPIKSFIRQLLKAQKQDLLKKIEGLKKEKKKVPQAGMFGDCPNCNQEVNIKFVDSILREVRNQALEDIKKLL